MMGQNVRYHRAMSKSVPSLQARLLESALFYLGRYEAPMQGVRRVLQRRLQRWSEKEGWEIDEQAEASLNAVLDKLRQSGAVDDSRYAEARARSLHRSGRSGRAIRAYLASRGVAATLAEEALAQRGEEDGDPDLAAALLFARKKRLGRFRLPELRADKRDRDLAAMGRAGFSWELARRVVDQDEDE
jgi:regulatory protein